MTAQELKATAILTLPLTEVSAKIGTGADRPRPRIGQPAWAGILPIQFEHGCPDPDPEFDPQITLPAHAADYRFAPSPPAEQGRAVHPAA